MKNLQNIYKTCLTELSSIGIKPGKITRIEPTKRKTTKTWGTCYYNTLSNSYRITINRRILQDDTNEHAVKETVIHEILHACTKCCGHKGKWKALANKVHRELGYDVTRTTKLENFGISKDEAGYKYVVICDECNTKYYKSRNVGCVKRPFNYRCKCGGRLSSYTMEQYKKMEKQEEELLNEELGWEQLALF